MSFLTKIKNSIPNFLTCCSLFFGCGAVFWALDARSYPDLFEVSLWCVLVGAVFDFSDGFAARLLNATSAIGKELDSLADQVTFGVAPGFIVFFWWNTQSPVQFLPVLSFLIPICSALRLAKFNIDTRQTSSFIGLATPANAIFFASLVAADFDFMRESPWIMAVLVIISSYLLVSEIPMFSLKFKHFGFKGNEDKFLLIGFAVVALLSALLIDGRTVYSVIPLIILFYIAICLFEFVKSKLNDRGYKKYN